jgi:hypothetical protein
MKGIHLMNSNYSMAEIENLFVMPKWADAQFSDEAIDHDGYGDMSRAWSMAPHIGEPGIETVVSRLDYFEENGEGFKTGETGIDASVKTSSKSSADINELTSAQARSLAWALFAAADDLDIVNGVIVTPDIEVITFPDDPSAHQRIVIPSVYSDYSAYVEENDDRSGWTVNPAPTSDADLSIEDARVLVGEVVSMINLAERLSKKP